MAYCQLLRAGATFQFPSLRLRSAGVGVSLAHALAELRRGCLLSGAALRWTVLGGGMDTQRS